MNVGCSGDGGDLVYCLGVLAELPGGPHDLYLQQSTTAVTTLKNPGAAQRLLDLTKRLVESQPYIKSYQIQGNEKMDWESGEFRSSPHFQKTSTIFQAHISHLKTVVKGLPNITGKNPWLKIEPSPDSAGKGVINRTPRYNNPFFPWKEVVDFYGAPNLLFVGTHDEHERFCEKFGQVPYYPTKDFYEVATLIAGSAIFIGNQSCANAIAEGLKHAAIQETCLHTPDCIFIRDNIQHVGDGACRLPSLTGGDPLVIPAARPPSSVNTNIVPNGGWQIDGALMGRSWSTALRSTQARFGMDETGARNLLLDKQAERLPLKFTRASTTSFATFNKAITTAHQA